MMQSAGQARAEPAQERTRPEMQERRRVWTRSFLKSVTLFKTMRSHKNPTTSVTAEPQM